MDWSEPLRTLKDAEAFYRAHHCNGFHMYREHPKRYAEYEGMEITQVTEASWMREECETLIAELFQAPGPSPTHWWQHHVAAEYIERLRATDLLRRFVSVTGHLRPLVPYRDRILVAETTVGRHVPNEEGPIWTARSLRAFDVAQALVALVPAFLNGTSEIMGAPPLAERKAKVILRLDALGEAPRVEGERAD